MDIWGGIVSTAKWAYNGMPVALASGRKVWLVGSVIEGVETLGTAGYLTYQGKYGSALAELGTGTVSTALYVIPGVGWAAGDAVREGAYQAFERTGSGIEIRQSNTMQVLKLAHGVTTWALSPGEPAMTPEQQQEKFLQTVEAAKKDPKVLESLSEENRKSVEAAIEAEKKAQAQAQNPIPDWLMKLVAGFIAWFSAKPQEKAKDETTVQPQTTTQVKTPQTVQEKTKDVANNNREVIEPLKPVELKVDSTKAPEFKTPIIPLSNEQQADTGKEAATR